MKDQDKTKEQFINELTGLRKRNDELSKAKTKIKKLRESLKKVKKENRSITELTSDGILTCDIKGVVTSCNNSFLRLTGFLKDEIVGRHFTKLPTLRMRDIPKYIKIFSSMIMGKTPKPLEFVWIHNDGTERWGEAYLRLMRREREIIEIQGIFKDITERKKAEEQIFRANERLNHLLSSGSGVIYVAKCSGDYAATYISDNVTRIVGFKPQEFLGESSFWFDHIHSDDVPRISTEVSQVLDKNFHNCEYRFRCKDGTYIWVRDEMKLVRGVDGKPLEIIGFWFDITERKLGEEALRESEEKYSSVVEGSKDAIVIHRDGIIKFVNNAASELSGFSVDDLLDKNMMDFIVPEYHELVGKRYSDRVRGNKVPSIYEIVIKKKDGTLLPAELNATIIKYDEEPAALIFLRDISERKQAEKEKERLQARLMQSEKMAGIGTLTSGIAHEFNNLLQIMSGNVQLAQRTQKPEDMAEALDTVANISDRATKIIRDLLAFSRQDTAGKEPCDVSDVVESVLSLMEGQLRKCNIEVVRGYEETSELRVDRGELQQVFLNMVTNARDAMTPSGGILRIDVRERDGNVEVRFGDTGEGIGERDLGRVFEPFYTTKGAVGGSTTVSGTGLGLSVSYGIVKRHGGEIEVESRKGEGTVFTVRLPVGDECKKKKVGR